MIRNPEEICTCGHPDKDHNIHGACHTKIAKGMKKVGWGYLILYCECPAFKRDNLKWLEQQYVQKQYDKNRRAYEKRSSQLKETI